MLPVEYCDENQQILTQKQFFGRYKNLDLSKYKKNQLIQNIERQGICILMELPPGNNMELSGYLKTFVFRDEVTKEFYIIPIDGIKVYVYVKNSSLFIYKMESEN